MFIIAGNGTWKGGCFKNKLNATPEFTCIKISTVNSFLRIQRTTRNCTGIISFGFTMNNKRVVSQPGMIVSGHNLETLVRRNCSRKSTDNKIEIENPRSLWEIVGGTTIWLPTTSLKTGLYGVMSNAIKDLSVFSLSPIGFEVEWHSSQFDKWY